MSDKSSKVKSVPWPQIKAYLANHWIHQAQDDGFLEIKAYKKDTLPYLISKCKRLRNIFRAWIATLKKTLVNSRTTQMNKRKTSSKPSSKEKKQIIELEEQLETKEKQIQELIQKLGESKDKDETIANHQKSTQNINYPNL